MPNADIYARLHREYLQSEHPDLYKKLKASGELLEDFVERVKRLEQLPHVVSELVMNDVIYNYPPPKQR